MRANIGGELDRRGFLRTVVLGSVGAATAWPRRASWATEGAAADLRFVYFTDVHTRVEWETPLALEKAAAAINARGADLAIAGGDLITDGFDARPADVEHRWKAYLDFHASLHGTVRAAIGNHDLVGAVPRDGGAPEPDPRRMFREKMRVDSTHDSFEMGGCRFFLLDAMEVTGDELKYRGFVDDRQMKWLQVELARTDPRQPLILVSHVPLLTSFYQATEGATAPAPRNRVVVNSAEVLRLFDAHNLLLVLQGHLHVNEMIRRRNTTFITGGAVAGKWWRGPWHGTEEGFGVVTLRSGRVDWEYVDYGWTARRPAGV